MSYNMTTIRFPSSDGKTGVYAEIYEPAKGEIRGILQLSHGMLDYVGRYEALASYLTDKGFVFAGNCHLGHGQTAPSDEELGYFGNGGLVNLVDDLHLMNIELKKRYPGIPIGIMGHSMGSFLSRIYVKKYPSDVSAHIIHGTGGPMPLILPIGKGIAKLISLLRGRRHRSRLLASMAFLGYNSKCDKSEGKHAWLTREGELVAGRDGDRYSNFTFTASAYLELFRMVGKSNSGEWFKNYPKKLKTLIMSGDMDPVGAYGKGPRYIYKHLLLSGADADLKLYEGARHELFNESCREEAFADILKFLEQTLK